MKQALALIFILSSQVLLASNTSFDDVFYKSHAILLNKSCQEKWAHDKTSLNAIYGNLKIEDIKPVTKKVFIQNEHTSTFEELEVKLARYFDVNSKEQKICIYDTTDKINESKAKFKKDVKIDEKNTVYAQGRDLYVINDKYSKKPPQVWKLESKTLAKSPSEKDVFVYKNGDKENVLEVRYDQVKLKKNHRGTFEYRGMAFVYFVDNRTNKQIKLFSCDVLSYAEKGGVHEFPSCYEKNHGRSIAVTDTGEMTSRIDLNSDGYIDFTFSSYADSQASYEEEYLSSPDGTFKLIKNSPVGE